MAPGVVGEGPGRPPGWGGGGADAMLHLPGPERARGLHASAHGLLRVGQREGRSSPTPWGRESRAHATIPTGDRPTSESLPLA